MQYISDRTRCTLSITLSTALVAWVLGGCMVDETEPDPAIPEQEVWNDRAVCDSITCAAPGRAAAVCEAEWGETSGKAYSIIATCQGNTTNSDCWSDCFRNYCQCGSTAGTPNACTDGGGSGVTCTCDTSSGSSGSLIAHRYWCCDGSDGTFHGWSDIDHCDA